MKESVYKVEPVKTMCEKLINEQIDSTNCLGISAFADCMNCPDLKMAAEEFAQLHFVDVFRLDEFLQLDIAQLTRLLHQDQLSVCSETQVYDAAVRWLKYNISNRQQHVPEVLRCVRLPLVFKTFLSETVKTEPLFKDNPECLQMITGALCKDLGTSSQPCRKKHIYFIGLFDGPHSRYFDPRNSSWTSISCPFAKRQNTTAVRWNGVVYMLGIKHIDCYNILKNSWYSEPGPPTPRVGMAACAFEGKIYTSGGSKAGKQGASALDLFESYDTVTESWQVNTSMLVSRCSHGSVEANGLIYVCGGMAYTGVSSRVLRNCEAYDPITQQWTKLCDMTVARRNHGLVVVDNRIYAVGGQGLTGGLVSVEYYNIASNEWHAVSRMPWRGLIVKCAAVGDVIYVVAGKGLGAQCLRKVLEYHTQSNRWVTSRAQAFSSTSCVICTVDP